MSDLDFNTDGEPPSKTKRKQASHELQTLGEAAAALPDDRLRSLAISETLLEAILTAAPIR